MRAANETHRRQANTEKADHATQKWIRLGWRTIDFAKMNVRVTGRSRTWPPRIRIRKVTVRNAVLRVPS